MVTAFLKTESEGSLKASNTLEPTKVSVLASLKPKAKQSFASFLSNFCLGVKPPTAVSPAKLEEAILS